MTEQDKKKDAFDELVYQTRSKAKQFSRQADKFVKEAQTYRAKAALELKANQVECAKMYANQSVAFNKKALQFR